ncbi:hypothetical protein LO763_23430 [Glycomyces sp. A-F 0318]|uniref:hypothetical protein n=1 Tax=Glycomyces amatae TaxID=2881355 RepID=UPI001E63C46B|nr:hypothetical protein [Glycomyces amatae]MCD0446574.1 hypothetical protein [Glycomyces amatae]
MSNLTLSIDDELLRRARMRALELDTTVNAVVREYLEGFAGESPTKRALADFLDLTEGVSASSGPDGRGWTREDLYDR